ncbi:MAG TPA: hypothetical protein VLK84_25155 [Longimicrobium sp.]|nr:hypothetical protein [Longimicrobium sp.]
MRLFAAVAAAAVLVLAAPAAAQPEPSALVRDVLERAHQNAPAGVDDYLVTLVSGPARVQLYLARHGDEWEVVEERDAPLADLFEGMLIWPKLAEQFRAGMTAADVAAAQPGTRDLGVETAGGRAAHGVAMRIPGLTMESMPMPDSAHVWVDAETRQVLRVVASADMDPSYGGVMRRGGHVDMELHFDGYESFNGVTLPRRWRIVTRMQANLTDAERQEMRDQVQGLMGSGTAEEEAQNRMLVDLMRQMLDGEPMDVTATVEDVQVNPGRPEWAQDG